MSTSLGLPSGVVRVVPYDPAWATLFAAEAERLRAMAGSLDLQLEHVGSTAVPGLVAKPILDILGGRLSEFAAQGGAVLSSNQRERRRLHHEHLG